MLTALKVSLVVPIALAVVSCAVTPPARAPYTGPDNIAAISSDMIVGHWKVKILNPIEGEETVKEARANYFPDGTIVLTAESQNSAASMGNMVLEMTGSWSIEGGSVRQQLETIEETTGNTMAKFLIGLMGNVKDRYTGTANLYEADDNRLVLVSDDGQAQELTRIP